MQGEGASRAEDRTQVPATQGRWSVLRLRNCRWFFGGQVFASIGVWLQRIAQDWLVLSLSNNSPLALGLTVVAQFLPMLLLSLWAGLLADRSDKRRLLVRVQVGLALQCLILGALVLTQVVQLWHVFVLSALFGCLAALELPARQAFVAEVAGVEHIDRAVALNSIVINGGRMIGPALAGLLIVTVDIGWVFVGYAVAALAMAGALLAIRPGELFRLDAVDRRKGQIMEALRYVRARADLVAVLVAVFFVSTFTITYFVTLALFANGVFKTGADGYGLMATLLAIGTFAGALSVGLRSRLTMSAVHVVLGSAVVLGLVEVIAGLMPTYALFAVPLILLGFFSVWFLNSANAYVQTLIEPHMRGRVMGLYVLVLVGGAPITGLYAGLLANWAGVRSTFVVGGTVSVLAGLGCIAALRRYASHDERPARADRSEHAREAG